MPAGPTSPKPGPILLKQAEIAVKFVVISNESNKETAKRENTKIMKYKTKYRIYQLEKLLPLDKFIRISNSIIIKKNSIRYIKPALNCRFYLTLTNGDVVDVTRTYYYKFKEFYGI